MQLYGGCRCAEILNTGGGQAVAESFQQHGGFGLGKCYQVARERIVIDGFAQVFAHAGKAGGRGQ